MSKAMPEWELEARRTRWIVRGCFVLLGIWALFFVAGDIDRLGERSDFMKLYRGAEKLAEH